MDPREIESAKRRSFVTKKANNNSHRNSNISSNVLRDRNSLVTTTGWRQPRKEYDSVADDEDKSSIREEDEEDEEGDADESRGDMFDDNDENAAPAANVPLPAPADEPLVARRKSGRVFTPKKCTSCVEDEDVEKTSDSVKALKAELETMKLSKGVTTGDGSCTPTKFVDYASPEKLTSRGSSPAKLGHRESARLVEGVLESVSSQSMTSKRRLPFPSNFNFLSQAPSLRQPDQGT